MKIVHVNWKYYPDLQGGACVYPYNLINQLLALGHEVKVFCSRHSSGEKQFTLTRERLRGVEIARIAIRNTSIRKGFFPYFRYYNPSVARVFKEYLLAERPQIVHFHTPLSLGAALVTEPRKLGIPAVATLHEGWWVCRQHFFDNRIYNIPCARKTLGGCILCVADPHKEERFHACKLFFRLAQSILNTPMIDRYCFYQLGAMETLISPSLFVAGKYINNGVKGEKIIHRVYGIDTKILKGIIRERKRTCRLRIAFLGGTNSPIKGFGLLMEAIKKVENKKGFSLRVWGAINQDLAQKAIADNLETEINFYQYFNRDCIAEVFSAVDILVVPSLVSENCPLVILEAYAAGVPVIASDVGGIPELVKNGINGLLFKFGDSDDLAAKLSSLVNNPGLVAKLAAGIGPVRTIEEDAQDTIQIYQRHIS